MTDLERKLPEKSASLSYENVRTSNDGQCTVTVTGDGAGKPGAVHHSLCANGSNLFGKGSKVVAFLGVEAHVTEQTAVEGSCPAGYSAGRSSFSLLVAGGVVGGSNLNACDIANLLPQP